MKHRTGTFQEFKDHTVAVARGERRADPCEPKIWCEPIELGRSQQDQAEHDRACYGEGNKQSP